MKIFNIKKLFSVLTCLTFSLSLFFSPMIYAHGWGNDGYSNNKYQEHKKKRDFRKHKYSYNFDRNRGKHRGHFNERGKHKGHHNARNPWWWKYFKDKHNDEPEEETGVPVDITFIDRGLNPGTTFNATYDSLLTVQDVLNDLLGDSSGGYALQECFETSDPIGGTFSDCDPDESPTPISGNLTLEAAGILDDPVIYLVTQ